MVGRVRMCGAGILSRDAEGMSPRADRWNHVGRRHVDGPGLVVDVARDGVVALGLEVNVDYVGVQATDLAGGSRYKGMEAADNREVIGLLTEAYALRRYSGELEQRRQDILGE